ncbi:adenylate/guanylate cyclase domain-containing protein (plasmid) [Sinorhizobium sp. M103]|nr:adenylate/guanylate cyclase domain-containing protein [Sinorhizobium sp. M103]WEJ11734.1 adenylate/guanylate cyclase domain-containing protein [Sinorhizobium sp. M103]
MWFGFGAFYLPDSKMQTVALIDLGMAVLLLCVPLLHRIGPKAAAIAFVSVSYPGIFVVCFLVGTDSGMQMEYLAFAAGAVLILGVEPLAPPLIVGILSLALILALEIFAPQNGGLLDETAMLGGFIAVVTATTAVMFAVVFYAVREAARSETVAEVEYARSESLLANVLPKAVADRLRSSAAQIIADKHEHASILFADMAGFTAEASQTSPVKLVGFLNDVFTAFDQLVERHGLEKIKTSGDNYMVVSGVPVARSDHAAALVRLGIEMLDAAGRLHDPHERAVSIRIGISSGPVVAGVVGVKKFFYDVWGDAVNVASRMETTGLPGRIQVSPETYEQASDQFDFECRGPVDVKGKGKMVTWLLVGPKIGTTRSEG